LRDAAEDWRAWLFERALPLWWSVGFDARARIFHERIDQSGAPSPDTFRRVRVQARQTFVFARAGRLGWQGPWRDAASAGVETLLRACLRPDGGVRHLLDPRGAALDERRDLYDTAFVVLAFAEAATALDRSDLAAAAERLIDWVEQNWSLAQGGFDEGDVAPAPPRRQNPHMHLFEALLALYDATGDARHLARAERLAALARQHLIQPSGALTEYFDDAWRPAPGDEGQIIEPGHLFEWSWLLHRLGALGGSRMEDAAHKLCDIAELRGVGANGAIRDAIMLDGAVRTPASRLWPNTERLKAHLVALERTGDARHAHAVLSASAMLSAFCATPVNGLWRDKRVDGAFVDEPAPASSFYHIVMALSELFRVTRI